MANDKARLKIIHAVLSLDCGGLERLVLHLCREGIRYGDEITVLCLDKPGKLADEVRKTGANVITLLRKPGLMRLSEAIRLWRLLREIAPDVIHCHQMGAALYAGSLARTLRIPAIFHTEHGNHDYERWRQWLIASIAFGTAHKLYSVSRDIADNLCRTRVYSKQPAIQFNGIPIPDSKILKANPKLRKALGIDAQSIVIGTVGRLVGIKRQERLLQAAADLNGRGIDAHLILVGEGPRLEALTNMSEQMGLRNRVHFVGFQLDPLPYLNLMNIFALTSDSEGMPMALLEAWAAEKPVVVTAVGGLPELIDDGNNGILVPVNDQSRLNAALEMLARSPDKRQRLGQNGRLLVQKQYSVRKTAAIYRSAYMEFLQRG